jgi:hypothetical protein
MPYASFHSNHAAHKVEDNDNLKIAVTAMEILDGNDDHVDHTDGVHDTEMAEMAVQPADAGEGEASIVIDISHHMKPC